MKKIFLGLFIVIFCFAGAKAANQEKVLSKEEKRIAEKKVELRIKEGEISTKIDSLYEQIESLKKELIKLEEQVIALGVPKEDQDLSWLDKYSPQKREEESKSLGDDFSFKNSLEELKRIKADIERETSRQVFNEISLRNDMLMFDSMQRSRISDYYFWSLFPDNPYNPYRYSYLKPLNLKGWDYILLFELLRRK
jgi:hypothetical protein